MRVFLNAIVVQIIFTIYICWWGYRVLPPKNYIRIPYISIFITELIIYFVGFLAADYLSLPQVYWVTWVGTSWMVFILYFFVLLFGYDFIRFLNKKQRILPRAIDFSSKQLKLTYFCFTLGLVLCFMIYGHYRFHNSTVSELTIEVKKDSPIKELKIVMVSDIHAGALIKKNILSMYVDRIMEQKPDLILAVGDIIDYDLKSVSVQKMEEEFRRLKAPYGVYASTGNHEYIQLDDEVQDAKIKWLADVAGFTVLRDSVVLIDSAFYIAGREDDKFEARKPLNAIIENINKDYPLIVMNHEPKRLSEESEAGADIALYGHTHNGQLFPYNFMMDVIYEVGHGYKKKGNTHVYVSSGLGLAGPQYRIGTISEIVVLNVKFVKE